MTNALLIIDMQNDFVLLNGALSVPGAEDDAQRVHDFIVNNKRKIQQITLTADSHYPYHIAHSIFWKDKDGNHPAPFTTITLQDVKDGKYQTAVNPQWAVRYLTELEANGKTLTIWPMHCLVSGEGWCIYKDVFDAIVDWSIETCIPYRMEFKGSNILTESYSVLKSEVPVPNCPETQLNQNLLDTLNKYDRVFLCGEAQSHCVKFTLDDLNTYAPDLVKKMVILTDCMSPIGNFDINTDPVYQKAVSLGAKLMKSTEVTF